MYRKKICVLSIFLAVILLFCGCKAANAQTVMNDQDMKDETSENAKMAINDVSNNEQTGISSQVNVENNGSSKAQSKATSSKNTSSTSMITKYDIPESEVMPKTIDDVIQLPVTKLDAMLDGNAIPFSVGVQKNIGSSDDNNKFNVTVAKSLVQLKEIYDKDNNSKQDNYIEKYNETYFQDNAVIVMFVTESSGSLRHQIDSLVKKNGELCIGMTTLTPGPGTAGTCDMACWRILIEVKKSDISDVEKLSYFNCLLLNDKVISTLPITKRDAMLDGDAVPFSLGVQKNIGSSDDKNKFNVTVAKSLVQLKDIYDKDNNSNQDNYIEKYNEAYFQDNAVIVMYVTESSGTIKHKIDSLVKKNGELCIGMTTLTPEPGTVGTCDMACWRILIEVKKSDISDVEKLSYFNSVKSNEVKSPLPIAKRDAMLDGDAVPFSVGVQKNIGSSDDKNKFNVTVAKSLAQLKDIYVNDYNPNQDNYIEKYNETYFQDNAVIVMYVTESSGTIKHKIDSLVKKNGELCIGMTTLTPGPGTKGTCDMAYWRILIEVKQSDISDVEKLSYFNSVKLNEVISPLPITKRDAMLDGDAIPFSVGVQKNIGSSDNGRGLNAVIVKSLEQLKYIYEKDSNPNNINYIEKYDEAFFKENAVVVVFVTESSGSNKLKFDSLVKKNGELCIGMTTLTPGPGTAGTCDMACWCILIEVKKSDIADVGNISYYNVRK